jgi:hypothetical protein
MQSRACCRSRLLVMSTSLSLRTCSAEEGPPPEDSGGAFLFMPVRGSPVYSLLLAGQRTRHRRKGWCNRHDRRRHGRDG